MRVESIIMAVGLTIAVAVAIALSAHPLATAIALAGGVALAVVAVELGRWRPVRIAFYTVVALPPVAMLILAGINFGPAAAVRTIAIWATFTAVAFCFAYVFDKISETDDPRFQILMPIFFSSLWVLCAWLGSSFEVLCIFGGGILAMFCVNLWRLVQWKWFPHRYQDAKTVERETYERLRRLSLEASGEAEAGPE